MSVKSKNEEKNEKYSLKKRILPEKTKYFWFFYVLGALLLTVGAMLMPVWSNTDLFFKNFGRAAVNFILCAAILLYIFTVLVKKFYTEKKESVRLIVVVEIVVFTIIAIATLLDEFGAINIGGPAVILGVSVWSAGSVSFVRGYLYKHTEEERKYTFLNLILAIFLVTLGTALAVRPFFTMNHLVWICAGFTILTGAFALLLGVLTTPEKTPEQIAEAQRKKAEKAAKKQAQKESKAKKTEAHSENSTSQQAKTPEEESISVPKSTDAADEKSNETAETDLPVSDPSENKDSDTQSTPPSVEQ